MSYGVHSTRYTNLSNEELYSIYRESAYSQLREEEKLDLVQETVNRDAVERGEIGSPEVRFIELPVNESGDTADGVININRDMAVFGIQSCEYKGRVINHNIEDYNIQTLNTAIHENTHCIQSQIVEVIIDRCVLCMGKDRAISQYMALHEESNSDTGTINSEVESQIENNDNSIVKTNDYIMPDSASRYLELSDIETLDDDDLQMIIYEIIARHGHEFILQKNMDYFKTKAWYTPIPGKTDREIYSEFNEYERANMTFLKQQLKERKV